MLVLVRHNDEGFFIPLDNGERIQITILESKLGRSRVGIEAPKRIRVLRNEQENASQPGERNVSEPTPPNPSRSTRTRQAAGRNEPEPSRRDQSG